MKKGANKLGKYTFMKGSEELVPHLPETRKMTKSRISKSSITNLPLEIILSDIHRVALLAGNRLNEYYPRQRIFGLDIGLDKNGHVWIIEANKSPSMSHFKKMKNFVMYRRIMKYKKASD